MSSQSTSLTPPPPFRHKVGHNWQGSRGDSFTEQYLDSTGIFKDAVVSIMATIGRQENVRRSERIRAKLDKLKAAGVKLGRPRVKLSKASRTTLWRRSREKEAVKVQKPRSRTGPAMA